MTGVLVVLAVVVACGALAALGLCLMHGALAEDDRPHEDEDGWEI